MTTHIDDHGGIFRCLLRVRENSGKPVMSDREFLRRYGEREAGPVESFGWNLGPVKTAAAALSLNFDFQTTASYEELLGDHRAGHIVLIRVAGAPLGLHSRGENDFRVTVLVDMDELELSLWCPLRNGSWQFLPSVGRNRWEDIQGLGMTLLASQPSDALLR